MKRDLTPRAIVAELDRYIVGQGKAKRAVRLPCGATAGNGCRLSSVMR